MNAPSRPVMRRLFSLVLLGGSLAVLAAACGGGNQLIADEPETTVAPVTALDGDIPLGRLSGMRGTTPAVSPDELFLERLEAFAPGLAEPQYAAEAYDIVMVAALAAETGRSDSPGRIAREIIGVTRGPGEKCATWRACRDLTDARIPIDYDGVSGAIGMLVTGEPGEGTYGVMEFDAIDQLEQTAVRSALAPTPLVSPPEADFRSGPRADGVFRIGMVLPSTGAEEAIGAAERAGVELAVQEINDFGGVLGTPIELLDGDAGTIDDDVALETARSHIDAGADLIIGASNTDITLEILPEVTEAGVMLISPATTAEIFALAPDSGLFFRISPSDVMQAQVLADVLTGDGYISALVLAEDSPTGAGISDDFAEALEERGGSVESLIRFAPSASVDPAVVSAALAARADTVVVFGSIEPTGALITSLAANGRGPEQVPYFMGNISGELANYVN